MKELKQAQIKIFLMQYVVLSNTGEPIIRVEDIDKIAKSFLIFLKEKK